MSVLIAVVIMLVLVLLLTTLANKGKSKGKGKQQKVKNKAQIIKEANRRLARNPHDPIGLNMIGNVYFTSQIWDKAFSTYNELCKLGLKGGVNNMAECYLRAGICALQLNKLPEANQALLNAYKMDLSSFDTNYYLGQAMYKQEKYDKAFPLFKKAILAKPEATGVYFLLAQSLYKSKRYKDCLQFYKRALDEEAGNKEALFNMADAMFQEGKGDKAIKVFLHLRADPTYGPKSCLRAGAYHQKINDLTSAMQDYEIGLKHEKLPTDIQIEIEYNLARCCFEKKQMAQGLALLKSIRNKSQNYKDVNSLITRYQELSQNSNLQIYVAAGSSDFVTLCRKFILVKYKNSNVKIQNTEVDALYTDILADVFTTSWEDVVLFRFFRTTGTTGEIYVRDFHEHMADVNAERGFCISAGTFSEEAKKYIEGRPIDLIEKNELTKVLKHIS